jgi:hypothetical protein
MRHVHADGTATPWVRPSNAPRAQYTLTGGLIWVLPQTPALCVQWWGPGCSLALVSFEAGGTLTPIYFDGYPKKFATAREAREAFAEFWARDGAGGAGT